MVLTSRGMARNKQLAELSLRSTTVAIGLMEVFDLWWRIGWKTGGCAMRLPLRRLAYTCEDR